MCIPTIVRRRVNYSPLSSPASSSTIHSVFSATPTSATPDEMTPLSTSSYVMVQPPGSGSTGGSSSVGSEGGTRFQGFSPEEATSSIMPLTLSGGRRPTKSSSRNRNSSSNNASASGAADNTAVHSTPRSRDADATVEWNHTGKSLFEEI